MCLVSLGEKSNQWANYLSRMLHFGLSLLIVLVHPASPQLDRGSSLLPKVSSTLKQKMAAFQTLMDCEGYSPAQKEDKDTGGLFALDYLSGEVSLSLDYGFFFPPLESAIPVGML